MGLTRKFRYVDVGHIFDPPLFVTNASIVSLDNVCLAFCIVACNDLYILEGDIQNTYLNALTNDKVFLLAGDEQ